VRAGLAYGSTFLLSAIKHTTQSVVFGSFKEQMS
jgi:hypothetical protein